MNSRNYFGLFIIFAVILSMTGYYFWQNISRNSNIFSNSLNPSIVEVKGYLGWEKRGFFEDSEVQEILAKNYGLKVEINKKGSIEMVSEPVENMDYLFPSNKIALEIYNQKKPDAISETIFFSPIVVYSWKSLLPDLVKAGLVNQRDGVNYLDLKQLILDIEAGKTWQDLGSQILRGQLQISSTDPSKSSSGNLFSSLVLRSLAGTQGVATKSDLNPEVQERVSKFFSQMGLLDSSSGDIFEKFLTLGRSTFPFAVGYESQFIEVINNKNLNLQDVAILYPEPTVWAEHEFISLNQKGLDLQSALSKEEQFTSIAWDRYGLRKSGRVINLERYESYGIPKELNAVIPLPKIEVMTEIINLL